MRDLIEREEAEILAARLAYAAGMEALGNQLTTALYEAAQRHADARAARLRVYDGEMVIPLPKATTEPLGTASREQPPDEREETPDAPSHVDPGLPIAAE